MNLSICQMTRWFMGEMSMIWNLVWTFETTCSSVAHLYRPLYDSELTSWRLQRRYDGCSTNQPTTPSLEFTRSPVVDVVVVDGVAGNGTTLVLLPSYSPLLRPVLSSTSPTFSCPRKWRRVRPTAPTTLQLSSVILPHVRFGSIWI